MEIDAKLKPLYANLKRIEIGKYLYTKEFELFTIEINLDKIWESSKIKVISKKNYYVFGEHNTEYEEEAFIHILNAIYEQQYEIFEEFITTVLLNFANWHPTKIDFSAIHLNLKKLNISDKKLLEFTKAARKIRDSKPDKIEMKKVVQNNSSSKINNPKKVFIVHGHDDIARLELSRVLKDDLGLEPVILQEQPNVSIETIISKFERLARDCSCAIILVTPDDNIDGKQRARQNVILELGYFLGKFHEQENKKIAIIKKGDVEFPSDISGVIYLEYVKNIKELFYDLKRQFETWGYN